MAGFHVLYEIVSDSGRVARGGNPADLDQIQIREQIAETVRTGIFVNTRNNTSGYLSVADTTRPDYGDEHSFQVAFIDTPQLIQPPAHVPRVAIPPHTHTGTLVKQQKFTFHDLRTGLTSGDLLVENSGFLITQRVEPFLSVDPTGRTFAIFSSKHPITTTAFLQNARPGLGDVPVRIAQHTIPGGIPLVVQPQSSEGIMGPPSELLAGSGDSVTTAPAAVSPAATATGLRMVVQPPSKVTVNAPFDVVVEAIDDNGAVDTSYTAYVQLLLGTGGDSTVHLSGSTAVWFQNGVARFTGLKVDKAHSGCYLVAVPNDYIIPVMSNYFDVTAPGVATRLAITTQPKSSVIAGAPFSLIVSAQDSFGMAASGFNGKVTLALNGPSGDCTDELGGKLAVQAVRGRATFSGLTVPQAGIYSVTAASDGLGAASTNTFSVIAAAATHLVLEDNAGNVLTNSPFTAVVRAVDAFGNPASTFRGSVSITLLDNPGDSTLGGTLTATAVSGVATFSGLTLNHPGSGYTLAAASSGLAAGSSSAFDVTNSQLAVTTQPPAAISTADSFTVVVTAKDAAGNVDASFNGSVTIADNWGAPLGSTTTVQAVNGVATFSDLTLRQPGEFHSLTVSGPGVAPTTTDFFSVTAEATKLVLAAQPPSATTVGAGFGVTVAAEDDFGNIASGFGGSVTLGLADNPGNASLGGTLTVPAVDGLAVFSGLTIDQVDSGYTLAATSDALASATSSAIDVRAVGAATQLIVTVQPPDQMAAGSGFSVVITAEDASGNVDTGFSGNVSLTDVGGNLVAQMAATQGIASFTGLQVDVAGPNSLTATSDGVLATATDAFNVTPLAASDLLLALPLGNILVGVPFEVDGFALDSLGNFDANFTGNVTISLANYGSSD